MNLRRKAKSAAVSSLRSRLGSRPFIAKPLLKTLSTDYGPLGRPGDGPGPIAVVSVDFDVTSQSRSGNNSKGTQALLQLAEEHKIPITWAICGKTAEEDLKSYNAILNSSISHEIGVHTYSHLD